MGAIASSTPERQKLSSRFSTLLQECILSGRREPEFRAAAATGRRAPEQRPARLQDSLPEESLVGRPSDGSGRACLDVNHRSESVGPASWIFMNGEPDVLKSVWPPDIDLGYELKSISP